MPVMVVVSVQPEEEGVLHSVAWCCPLPSAALQVLWIRKTFFVLPGYDLLVIILWLVSLLLCGSIGRKCALKFSLNVCSLLCGTGTLCHLVGG